MTLRSNVHGILARDEISRLKFPVAWSGTVPPIEQASEEADLAALAREAIEQLDQAELYSESEGELAVRFDRGEITEVVSPKVEQWREAVEDQARKDAAMFAAEFGEAIDPENTDWDATAWEDARREIGLDTVDPGIVESLWLVYQAALVAETERLMGRTGE